MVIKQQIMSADAFWALLQSDYSQKHLELIEGELREMTPAGEEHGVIAGNLFGHIWQYVHQHKLGRVTAAETGYVVHLNPDGRDTVLAPDVGFTTKVNLPDNISSKFAPYAPDLAVEVVSPSDRANDIQEKVSKYLQYGTQIIWLVYPKTKEIVTYQDNSSLILTIDDTLSAEAVLGDFRLPLRDVFTS